MNFFSGSLNLDFGSAALNHYNQTQISLLWYRMTHFRCEKSIGERQKSIEKLAPLAELNTIDCIFNKISAQFMAIFYKYRRQMFCKVRLFFTPIYLTPII